MAQTQPFTTSISAFALQELLVEYANIRSLCPSGVYVSVSPTTPQIWYGVIFVRKGPYAGGIFRFILFFPDLYPFALPILKVISSLSSHPLVHPLTSEFDFSHGEKSYEQQLMYSEGDPERESIFRVNGRVLAGRVLSYFKRSFKSAGLDQAPGLYQRDPQRFCKLAAQDVALSRATHVLYEEDENGDPYAGDENGNVMNLALEENTVKFVRLDPGMASLPSTNSGNIATSPDSLVLSEKGSVISSLGEVGRGVWEILIRESHVS
ncbi:hypothetical protein V1506DRAFT_457421 [Lipomyces tetrasporus]